jgi:hypothetical protein
MPRGYFRGVVMINSVEANLARSINLAPLMLKGFKVVAAQVAGGVFEVF